MAVHMREMLHYLIKILEPEEKRAWKLLIVFGLVNPGMDIVSYSMVIYIINLVVGEGKASYGVIFLTFLMGVISIAKLFCEFYRCSLSIIPYINYP